MESPGQHGQLLTADAQRGSSCHNPAQCPGWLGARGLGTKGDKEATLGTQPFQGLPCAPGPNSKLKPPHPGSVPLFSFPGLCLSPSEGRLGGLPAPRSCQQAGEDKGLASTQCRLCGSSRANYVQLAAAVAGSFPACLPRLLLCGKHWGRCEDRGWGGAGGSPSQALTGSQVGQPSQCWLQLGP